MSPADGEAELHCPRCGRAHDSHERLCRDCNMPLVVSDAAQGEPRSPMHEEARKINPRFARGELIRVAVARNLSEAELIKGVLLEQGIPSMLRRTGGFDVPDFLVAGPRDVLVPAAGEQEARGLLADVEEADAVRVGEERERGVAFGPTPALKLAAALLAALLLFSAVAGIVYVLVA